MRSWKHIEGIFLVKFKLENGRREWTK